jgi:hypothetical protein
MNTSLHLGQLPLMVLAMAALLLGLWSGLLRLGWTWNGIGSHLPAIHGALMIGSFLGTLISLERAVAVDRRWAYAAPMLTGLGGVALALQILRFFTVRWPSSLLENCPPLRDKSR